MVVELVSWTTMKRCPLYEKLRRVITVLVEAPRGVGDGLEARECSSKGATKEICQNAAAPSPPPQAAAALRPLRGGQKQHFARSAGRLLKAL